MKALPKGQYIKQFQYRLGIIAESDETTRLWLNLATAQLDRKEMVSTQPEALCADSMINCMGSRGEYPRPLLFSGVCLWAPQVYK